MRKWMPIYTIIFFLFTIGFIYDNLKNHYHSLYVTWSVIAYALMTIGNILFIRAKSNSIIALVWKIIAPFVVIDFVLGGIIDMKYSSSAGQVPIVVNILIWMLGAALFLPTFIANFSVGYKKMAERKGEKA